jgi:hypothetical protein
MKKRDQPRKVVAQCYVHVRLAALKDRDEKEVFCLIATEDEAFTYNHKVNQISPIQEHFMIMKAIENGVSEERVARTLDVNVAHLRQKRDLLKGICAEAVELLKERRAPPTALRELKKVKPMRQMEMAELMIVSNNFIAPYATCVSVATPRDQRLEPDKDKKLHGLKPDDAARMEREREKLGRDSRLIEEPYGRNVLNLVPVVSYIRRLLDNAAVVRHLSRRHGDMLAEFQRIVEATTLEQEA